MPKTRYEAAIYARASRDDPDSETIENQIAIIRAFAEKMPDISIRGIYRDRGFTGINMERPGFERMLQAAQDGEINCFMFKDFSRLSRNYIDFGGFLERCSLRGLRVIAVSEGFDSLEPPAFSDKLIIPFKGFLNERVLADTSVKIRNALDARRRNGSFVGAFAPYGYRKDPEDRHRLIRDDPAAQVVMEIFRQKLHGLSNNGIALRLESLGEPSPLEYKRQRGINHNGYFQTGLRARWSAAAIGRILSNPVYIGVLEQGKQETVSYKLKKRVQVPQERRSVTPDAHEPIISRADFDLAQDLLAADTRIPPEAGVLYPYSGMIFCGDCGSPMVRKKAGGYCYYVCSRNKADRNSCTPHSISVTVLDESVLRVINGGLALSANIDEILDSLLHDEMKTRRTAQIRQSIQNRSVELEKNAHYQHGLQEERERGGLSQQEYELLFEAYSKEAKRLVAAVETLNMEAISLDERYEELQKLLSVLRSGPGFYEVTRAMSVRMIRRIEIGAGHNVHIKMRFRACILNGNGGDLHGQKKQEADASVRA